MSESKLRLRRAAVHDVDYLLDLQADPEISPFLAAGRAAASEDILAEVERSIAEPQTFGRFLIELSLDGEWRLAGAIGFECVNRRSRIAHLSGLAVHPDFRGHGLGAEAIRALARMLFGELGYHRLEVGVYGFNEQGMAVVEKAGFVREGVKRRAYCPHGEWVDAVEFGLLAGELEPDA
jgi:RimJ/RimL family protein N-acetyltransferase